MRHRKFGKKLGRNAPHRRALLRNMTAQLLTYGRVETTLSKGKLLIPYAERVITLAKRGGLACYRRAISAIGDRAVAKRLFDDIRSHVEDRPGGYLRLLHYARSPRRDSSREYYVTTNRLGDNAPMVFVEFVGYSEGTFGDLFTKAREASGGAEKESAEE